MGVNLANALIKRGYEVCVISFFRANKEPFYKLDSKILCLYLSHSPAKHKNPLIKLFNKTIFRLYLCVKTYKIIAKNDTILANDGWFVPIFNGLILKHLFFQNKDNFFIRLWHLKAPKKASKKLRLFDNLVILSPCELSLWQKYHKNISVIPNFLPEISCISTNHTQKRIVSVGRLSQEKGFLRLLDIWKILQDSIKSRDSALFSRDSTKLHDSAKSHDSTISQDSTNSQDSANSQDSTISSQYFNDLSKWKLIIVGDGILKAQIEQKINKLNLQHSVILKPFTKHIESEYLNASIYAMASFFEGFPMVLVEASSYALPCIAFDVATGPSDIIENSKSGFLIKDNDLESYAKKLMLLMSDENMRKSFGNEAKKIVEAKFSKDAVMKKWESILKTPF